MNLFSQIHNADNRYETPEASIHPVNESTRTISIRELALAVLDHWSCIPLVAPTFVVNPHLNDSEPQDLPENYDVLSPDDENLLDGYEDDLLNTDRTDR